MMWSKKDKIGLAICFTYLFLLTFYYHIDKYLSGVFFVILTFLMFILFIALFAYSIIGTIKIVKIRNKVSRGTLISVFGCITVICYSIFSPYRMTSEILESEVEFRACYEGTQNQATIKFRKDKTFELHWTGAFFANTWYTGKWNKSGNIIHLMYDQKNVEPLGNIVLIKDGFLHKIDKTEKAEKFDSPMFYLGYCKNEN